MDAARKILWENTLRRLLECALGDIDDTLKHHLWDPKASWTLFGMASVLLSGCWRLAICDFLMLHFCEAFVFVSLHNSRVWLCSGLGMITCWDVSIQTRFLHHHCLYQGAQMSFKGCLFGEEGQNQSGGVPLRAIFHLIVYSEGFFGYKS